MIFFFFFFFFDVSHDHWTAIYLNYFAELICQGIRMGAVKKCWTEMAWIKVRKQTRVEGGHVLTHVCFSVSASCNQDDPKSYGFYKTCKSSLSEYLQSSILRPFCRAHLRHGLDLNGVCTLRSSVHKDTTIQNKVCGQIKYVGQAEVCPQLSTLVFICYICYIVLHPNNQSVRRQKGLSVY